MEIPGPPTFHVYRTVLLMIRHPPVTAGAAPVPVTIAALEEYHDRISDLVKEFPECWHLVMQAGRAVRARQAGFDPCQAGEPPADESEFNTEQPWNGAFAFAARDRDFWDRNVVRSANLHCARRWQEIHWQEGSGRHAAVSSRAASHPHWLLQARGIKGSKATHQREGKVGSPTAGGGSCARGGQSSGNGGGGHPRKSGREFQTDREGNEICFGFSKARNLAWTIAPTVASIALAPIRTRSVRARALARVERGVSASDKRRTELRWWPTTRSRRCMQI